MVWCALGLAVLSAIFMAVGTHLQSIAVVAGTDGRLTAAAMLRLLRSPRWAGGLALLGVGTALNVTALSLAPVSVIQPVGVLALAIITVLHCRHVGLRINAQTWRALLLCAGGAAMFVLTAVRYTDPALRITERSATVVTMILVAVLTAVVLGLATLRGHARELLLLVSAGALYGFVALEMKIITAQVQMIEGAWWHGIGILNVIGLLLAAAVGGWLVQSAYASGPPELVMAGLTVVDPMIGVIIGLSVLGEAGPDFGLGPALLLILCAAVSVSGVRVMARHHPEVLARQPVAEAPDQHRADPTCPDATRPDPTRPDPTRRRTETQ
ncbi:DMT family transporter [Kocuria palustris]|uniref:DMT family transporter n=1 Tax=Kocuria palustris TaxID=71999 RepID=UPI00119DC98C|nr:DMT family transporter [Kocuria palustris]